MIANIWQKHFVTWTLQKIYKKYLEDFECGAGEGWIRSVGSIV
jgi:hypothetical protein